jgi:hypothetical protein
MCRASDWLQCLVRVAVLSKVKLTQITYADGSGALEASHVAVRGFSGNRDWNAEIECIRRISFRTQADLHFRSYTKQPKGRIFGAVPRT